MWKAMIIFEVLVTALAFTLCHAAEAEITKEDKDAFVRVLEKAPSEGEFFTAAGIDQLAPHIRTLFALTTEDIAPYDLYPFLAMSRGLCDRPKYLKYGAKHFAEIAHPGIKLGWAVMLFDAGSASSEVVGYLREALQSEERTSELAEFLGPEFEEFKKRLAGWEVARP
jgi:hypothetical protein